MNTINNNVNNYNVHHKEPGFKADMMYSPIPGLMMPQDFNANSSLENVPNSDLPDLYYMPESYQKPKTFMDKIKKADIMGLIAPWFEHPLLMLGTAAGLSIGVDKFDKSCNKEYEKSIVGRAAKFGDNIQESKFVQSNGVQKVLKFIKNGWGKIKTTAMKSNMIRAMVESPTRPEWAMPKSELETTNQRIVQKFRELASKLGLTPDGGTELNFRLKNLVLDDAEMNGLKKLYNVKKLSKLSNAKESEAVNRIILQRLGCSKDEIVSILSSNSASETVVKEILKKSGLTEIEVKTIFEDTTGKSINLIEKACKNLKNLRFANGRLAIMGSYQPFTSIESPFGICNRIASKTVGEGAKTKTGAFMSKLVQKLHEMFTFRGGGKGTVLLWVTPMLATAVLNTIKAEKEEKVGTAVSGVINSFAWVLYFPIVLKAIHAFGGIQYTGMGKAKVAEYLKDKQDFNKLVTEQKFGSWKEYWNAKRALKKKLKGMRQVKNQNLLTETLRGISRFSKSDLVKLESYQNKSVIGNFVRRIPNLMKDYVIFGPGRFILFLFGGAALADKLIEKTTTKLFGKGYDDLKDKEMESEKEKQEEFTMNDLRARMVEIQNSKLNPQAEEKVAEVKEISTDKTPKMVPESMIELAKKAEEPVELLKPEALNENVTVEQEKITPNANVDAEEVQSKDNQIAENSQQNKNVMEVFMPEIKRTDATAEQHIKAKAIEEKKYDNYTYIPSSENVLKNSDNTPQVNKYIPAQTAIKINKVFDNSGLESAIKRANRAEQRALSTLAGNFGSAS